MATAAAAVAASGMHTTQPLGQNHQAQAAGSGESRHPVRHHQLHLGRGRAWAPKKRATRPGRSSAWRKSGCRALNSMATASSNIAPIPKELQKLMDAAGITFIGASNGEQGQSTNFIDVDQIPKTHGRPCRLLPRLPAAAGQRSLEDQYGCSVRWAAPATSSSSDLSEHLERIGQPRPSRWACGWRRIRISGVRWSGRKDMRRVHGADRSQICLADRRYRASGFGRWRSRPNHQRLFPARRGNPSQGYLSPNIAAIP